MSSYGVDVLAFGAHPDDVELFCGGVVARLVELSRSVGVVDLSRGELASRGSPEERAREAEAASAVLGLRFRENLGLPDGHIQSGAEAEPRADSQLARVVEVLRRRRPELVLCPWLEERHPDHAAAGALVTRAVFFAGVGKLATAPPSERFVPRQLLYYPMRYRTRPSFVVDTSSVFARKLEAIRCYQSQLDRKPHEPATLIGSSQALAAIEARDRYYGSMLGVSFGEPLRSQSVPGLVDPVAHFRQNPFAEAHAFEDLS